MAVKTLTGDTSGPVVELEAVTKRFGPTPGRKLCAGAWDAGVPGALVLGTLWTPVQALPPAMVDITRIMPTYRYAHPAWNLLAGQSIHTADVGILLGYTVVFTGLATFLQKRLDAKPDSG